MSLPSTMRAAVQDRYGEADVIHVRKVRLPTITDDEVLLRGVACRAER